MDPIFLAAAATTWVLNKLLDHLKDAAIQALLGSEGFNKDVKHLVHELSRANLVLGSVTAGATSGVMIGNQELARQITEVLEQAVKLAKYLDKLRYYDLEEKVRLY
uniref:Rx N-terminal domain-containing protein n=2 Tax=Aegilops tauschii TaxID=37682 RepID=A0A453GT35_AEGTS